MSGGLITGNTSYKFDSDDRLLFGDGVFLHDGTFSMSGGALITQDNDVRLELGKSIIIDEYLAVGTQSVALISLPDYVLGRDVLTGGSASAAGTRFSLTEPGWSIVDGKLTNPASSSGGVISTVVDDVYGVRYQVHTFKDSGDFVSAYTGRASILLVGGGGGGGSAGGGGAGGFLEIDTVLLSIGSYALTVGTGGAGSRGAGSNGGDSSFGGSYTAYGGGGGGGGVYNIDGKPGSGTTSFASKMGSGGGGRGSFGESFPAGVGGTGSTNGGAGTVGAMGSSGGGGGAGGDGRDATDTSGGKGGSGTVSTISGGSVTYATGGTGSVKNPSAAQANTGNGGDGVFLYSGTDGGSGIVIIRFPIQ
jgi:hypothetical protein